uniref:Uncharacterized protein n=1 Tax=Tanacetum cinerariifolium TaxID=118510 RepID=A0A6L2KJT4_TANCI|nr:hypothetical protein [Tanacetum cinerariifolium]
MSPENMCHRDTNYLTENCVGPTISLGIVAVEHSPTNIPQRQVARERYPQRHVAGESLEMSLGNVVNFVVMLHFINCVVTLIVHISWQQYPTDHNVLIMYPIVSDPSQRMLRHCDGSDDYNYPLIAYRLEGDGDDGDYDYAPAASEGDGDDDDGDYDYAPAA